MRSIDDQFCRLNDLGKISRGRSQHRPRNAPHLYGGELPFIQTGDITNSELYVTKFSQTYSQAGIDQSRVWEPGVLCIVNAGVNTGDSAILAIKACFPDSVIVFRVDRSKCNSAYIKYYLDSIKLGIRSITMGATQDNLSVSKLLTIPVPKYPVAVQDKIAAILTAYDDLIEVNKRRIALLEKMAEELYREWFVRMRFPGHQNTKFVKGVPVGWVTTRFASICKFIKGRTPSELTLTPSEDHLPYINAAYLRGQEAEFAKRDRGSVICNDGDTLMLMDGSNSGLVFRAKHGIVASTFARISILEKYAHYIFEFLGASRDSILSNNTGSAVPHANKEFINRLIFYLPNSDQLLSDFNDKYEAIFQQKNILKQQIVNLTRTRDLLLPRLISGKLSVEDLEIQFPPNMREE